MSESKSNVPAKPAPPAEDDVAAPETRGAPLPSGRVQFDDRGNAVWEWNVSTGKFDTDVSSQRLKALQNPTLSIADDAPTPSQGSKSNPQGLVKGYNPYESGKLDEKKAAKPVKKDLRRLSEWIQLRKQAEKKSRGEE